MDLGGSAENQGDLKSVVLHKMALAAHKSTFPIGMPKASLITQYTHVHLHLTTPPCFAALGVRMTGVDDATYSQTGGLLPPLELHSACALPLKLRLSTHRELLDDRHAQRRLAHGAHHAGGQHRAGAHRLPLRTASLARSKLCAALLRRRTSS
jgi:hypothetical protein